MQISDLRRFLLSLIGPNADIHGAQGLEPDDWLQINAMSAQHRMQPHLHARIERGELEIPLPADIRARWRTAHRTSGIRALAMRKALYEVQLQLCAVGIQAIALKGASHAWDLYPAAAERPMRDIDLLLPHDRAVDAFNLLLTNGFMQEDPSPRTPEESLLHDKHLPPLVSPQGIRFELHMRLWERTEAIGWPMPEDESEAMLAQANASGGSGNIAALAPEDQLVHTVIHAVYSNRLNGGPLALVDLAYMAERDAVDWPQFWTRAARGGWDRGAALLLHMADQWRAPGLLEKSRCPICIDPSVLADVPDLLLQDLSHRKTVGAAASVFGKLSTDGVGATIAAIAGRLRGGDRARAPDAGEKGESFAGWFARRTGESAKALAHSDTRSVARTTSKLGAWLNADE